MSLSLFNTRTRKTESFVPLHDSKVGLYACGPTVYGDAHIGNMRTYFFEDVLVRTLRRAGYDVTHVMNITDVGHLVSDADDGEDKMAVGAKREGTSAWEIAKKYEKLFFADAAKLNILLPDIFCRATEHIPEQLALIKILEEKGFTYRTSDGLYFDTSMFPSYTDFAKINPDQMQQGKRIDMGQKRSKTDFALWKFSPTHETRDMEWDSPWGVGFPGWHIECSAMSSKYLGEQFDIHCGGIDHIPIHHSNEIAQSESASGKSPWVNVWMHSEFLVMDKGKMSKSAGGTLTVRTLEEKKYDPLVYRYLCLGTHYRKRLLFSWDSLDAAQSAFSRLQHHVLDLKKRVGDSVTMLPERYLELFDKALFYDINTPQALAIVWDVLKDENLSSEEKLGFLLDVDSVLGLGVKDMKEESVDIPSSVQELVQSRELARKNKKWSEADRLRNQIASCGFVVSDGDDGPIVSKK